MNDCNLMQQLFPLMRQKRGAPISIEECLTHLFQTEILKYLDAENYLVVLLNVRTSSFNVVFVNKGKI